MDTHDEELNREDCLLLQQPQDDAELCHRGLHIDSRTFSACSSMFPI